MTAATHCLGALALEVAADHGDAALTLPRAAAEALAGELALDLQRLLPGAERLDGVFAGAHFDPAELLRPGWPVHAALAELAALVPGEAGGRVIAFGAHDGRMPSPLLQPDPGFAGGLLRLLPFVLTGDAEQVAQVGRTMEQRLLDTGMAGARLALQTQSRFGLALEHARFMSMHDLCALTAMQYEHAGMTPVWRLLEAALLSPERVEWLREADEPTAVFAAGQIRIADPTDEQAAGGRRAVARLAAIVGAHGIPVERVPVPAGSDVEAALLPERH